MENYINNLEFRKKIFFRFLKENNCYKQFIMNFHNDKIKFQKYNLNEYIIIHNKNAKLIINTFNWSDTSTVKVKNNPWCKISDKWVQLVNEINNNNNNNI